MGIIKSSVNRPFHLIKCDGEAIGANSFKSILKEFFLNSGFSAVCIYRYQQYFQRKSAPKMAGFVSRINVALNGIEMVVGCEIGSPFIIRHPVGIVVGHKVTAGSKITIMQGVTIGQLSFEGDTEKASGNPKLGDNISLGAYSIILGNISIGSGAIVGAGTFLNKNLPENHLAKGNPAQIKPINLSPNANS